MRSSGLLDDFIRECEHGGRDVEPKSLPVASGDKDVAIATAPLNVTHSQLIRRLARDIPLKSI
jgi:hypothetical protein